MKYLLLILSMLFLPVLADEAKILPSQTGIVEKVQYVDLNDDTVSQTKQTIQVRLLTGEFKGETVELDNMLTGNPYYDIKLKKNTKVILHAEDNGEGVEFSIEDIKRSGNLGWLSLLFCGLLIYVGRKKGFYSLISIGLTVLLITHALSPLILIGINPVLATILICIASTAATMYLVGGFNAKSTSAVIGAMLSLLFAGLLSYITMFTAHLTGFTEENSMFLYTAHPELDFIGITISTMILATLGAVMDVAMSVSSSLHEIKENRPDISAKEIFHAGINIGRDMIGTMSNTLILAYAGGSLGLVMIIYAYSYQMHQILNMYSVAIEIMRGISGTMGIILTVPITSLIMSVLLTQKGKK